MRVIGDSFDVVLYKGGYEIVPKGVPHPKDREKLPIFKFGEIRRLFFEITDACNYRCIHCYNGDVRLDERILLAPETMEDSLKKIDIEYRVETIQITGGEPTLHPNLRQIIRVAKNHAKYVELFTNGYLLDNVDKILMHENVRVIVSMYSLNPNKYSYITGVQGLEKVVKNIIDFHELGGNIAVRIPVIPGINDVDAKKVIHFFRSKGIRASSSVIIPYGRSKNRKVLLNVKKKLPPNRNWSLAYIAAAGYSECWATHLAISWNLDVFPCIFAREYKLGNLAKDDIKTIRQKHEELSKRFAPDNLEECKSCALRYVCKRCPPRAKAYGLLGIREAHCPFALTLTMEI